MSAIEEFLHSQLSHTKSCSFDDSVGSGPEGGCTCGLAEKRMIRETIQAELTELRDLCEARANEIAQLRAEAETKRKAAAILYHYYKEQKALAQEMAIELEKACIGSCECLTKTPDPQYHSETCRYKGYRTVLTKYRQLNESQTQVPPAS